MVILGAGMHAHMHAHTRTMHDAYYEDAHMSIQSIHTTQYCVDEPGHTTSLGAFSALNNTASVCVMDVLHAACDESLAQYSSHYPCTLVL